MNQVVGNSQLIQKMNRLKVLNYIRKNPDTSRPEIVQATGLSMSSMTNITSYLLGKGLITENGTQKAERVGRKSTLLRFNAEAYSFVFVCLYVGSITISYTDMEGKIITRICVNTEQLEAQKVTETVIENVNALIYEYGKEKVLGIGVAISGMVLDGSRFVLSASLQWTEFDLKAVLEQETGLPVFIENISLLRAVWYFCCNRRIDKGNMLLVDLEKGIGASQYYNGEINHAMLGEIGHTTVERNGEPCFCGNKGCLEAMCSVKRILKLYEEYGGERVKTVKDIAKKLSNGDLAAERAVSECAQYLGIGFANLLNICKPSVIVINVGDFDALRQMIELATAEMRKRAYPALVKDIVIREVSISDEDVVRGAAFNLCGRLFDISYSGNVIE